MGKPNLFLLLLCVAMAGFIVGKWSGSGAVVRADSDNPQLIVRPVGADSSLVVYYPKLNKFFVYQNPFVGLPKWGCAYSVQLSTPGGDVTRLACNSPVQSF